MTVMLSLHAGYDVEYLTSAVGAGGADYYLSAAGKGGEPPGFWAGRGAEALGLAGNVDAQTMRNLYHHSVKPDGEPLTAQRPSSYQGMKDTLEDRIQAEIQARVEALGGDPTDRELEEIRLQVAGKQRNSVPFFDFTLSMAKSISVTAASYQAAAKAAEDKGDTETARQCMAKVHQIEQAVRAGAQQVVRSAEHGTAFVRTGHHGDGTGQWRDAAGLVAAVFLQHTSRDGDPQLHAHIAVLNKAQRADGEDVKWRTLDSRSLHRERLGLAARAGMVVEQHLTAAGFSLVPGGAGGGREIGGVTPATMRAFSARRTAITPAIQRLVDEYTATHGHAPSRRALWSLRQWATLETRRTKHEVERAAAESLAVWTAQSAEHEVQILADVRAAVEEFSTSKGTAPAPCTDDLHRAVRIAVHEVQRQNATWTVSQLAWELFRAMPARDAETDPVPLLQSMLTAALTGEVEGTDVVALAPSPDVTDVSMLGVRDSDGVSVYRPPGEARYCTADMLDTEEYLIAQARRKVSQAVSDDAAQEVTRKASLSSNQAEAVRGMLTSTTATTVLVGPPGSGKTHVMAVFAAAWAAATGNRVIGLTASTNAARVLKGEGLTESYNIADFLGKIKDSTQTRGHRTVHEGDVLVVDEASQVGTHDLAAIQAVAARCGARIILSGDYAQLSAVEAGGIMREIARRQGHWRLHEVRRFSRPWEARASLALREGDINAWVDYRRHGHVRHGNQPAAYTKAVELWAVDYVQGRETLLMTGSNAEAADLSRLARNLLAAWHVVSQEAGVTLADGNEAGTGDLVRARLNCKIDAGGLPLTNRDTLRITGWTGTGESKAATVERQTSRDTWSAPFEVPVAYLTESAELAYAGNVHVAEGRTVDTGHLIVSDTLSREGLLVGMTRGRDENTAHVVTGPAPFPGKEQEQAPPEAVITAAMEREDVALTATETIRDAQSWSTSSRHLFELWRALVRHETGPVIDQALSVRLPPAEFARYLADPERPILQQQLRTAELAGHDVGEVLDRVTEGGWAGARSIAACLHGRVEKLGLGGSGQTATWAERTPTRPQAGQSPPDLTWRQALDETVAALDHRQLELGMKLLDKPEPWAVRYIGMPPVEPGPLREDWMARAGRVASYREAAGHTDPEQAVGPAPVRNPELHEAYQASVKALEMQEEERVRSLPRGGLEARLQAYEQARAWAPEPVGRDLELTLQAERDAAVQAEMALREDKAALAASAASLAGTMRAERERLEVQQAARDEWEEATAAERVQAREAKAELQRRGHEEPDAGPVSEEPVAGRVWNSPSLRKAMQFAEAERGERQEREAEAPEAEVLASDTPVSSHRPAPERDHGAEQARAEAERWEIEQSVQRSWQAPEISEPGAEIEIEAGV